MTHDTMGPSDFGGSGEFDSQDAAVFAVLSECWSRPTESIVEIVNTGKLQGIVPDVEDVTLEDLRAEYTRLLLGPDPDQVPPYESVYRNRDPDEEFGPVRGASTEAVRKWYRTHGVAIADDNPEMPDHIATELEFAAYLADNNELEACEQFLDEHPRQWTGEFLSAVSERTRSPFYESLAAATERALSVELTGTE
ncbi:MAG: molecular chaperone TorD family protein [Halapricum sp.]